MFRFALPLLALFPTLATAESALTPTLTPGPRPYPYEILDIQPGALLPEAQAMFEERMMLQLVPEDVQIRVQSAAGREIEFRFTQEMVTQGVGVHTLLGRAPYAQMRMILATDVMEGRVLRIARTLRQPTAELPEPAALRAQIEGLYGPPSRTHIDSYTLGMTMTYARGTDGFIPDLDAVQEQTVEHDPGNGEMRAIQYRTCEDEPSNIDYRFEDQRQYPIMPGCVAIFRISFSGKADLSILSFELVDYDLIRQHQAEVDRQIRAALTDETTVAPSNLDL